VHNGQLCVLGRTVDSKAGCVLVEWEMRLASSAMAIQGHIDTVCTEREGKEAWTSYQWIMAAV